ncbi:MAG: STAS domain-containing protein [Candidatus Bathyarchaeota archaeon]|nr:STAS domain-containing protein [Candidatus Bathyarchaeota archaeon]
MEKRGRASILKIEDFLLATPEEAMHDLAAIQFKDDLLERVKETKISGLIIDLGRIDIVDSFMGRTIGEIANSAALLGAEVVVIGLRPEVAITMVEMGISLGQVHPLLNLDLALEFLRNQTRGV